MTTESEYINLVDYVADLRSKLQFGTNRLKKMQGWLQLLEDAKVPEVEVALWKDAMGDQEIYVSKLREQLHEYETFIGWR